MRALAPQCKTPNQESDHLSFSEGEISPETDTSRAVEQQVVWHALEASEVVRTLDTSPDVGLADEEAASRLKRYGNNELSEAPRPSVWSMIFDQFNNFLVVVLIVAALLAAILGDYIEAAAILAIVILNAILGVVQERRAEDALAALRRLSAPDAHIVRGGHRMKVPAREIVPGDIVLLEVGNYVPADMRLIETANLRIDEAALTGESVPVTKDAHLVLTQELALGDRRNTAFSGTLVAYGRGKGVVVSTGMRTQIGMIAEMIQSVHDEPTPLQYKLNQLGRTLGWAALGVCALVFFAGWLQDLPLVEMFLIAVSLAVAAVPEGLPAVVTITLALGMNEMITRHALIRRLSSVETLGSTTIICSDKTGTLTQNQMTVTRMWVDGQSFEISGGGYEPVGQFRVNGHAVDLADYPASTTALWVAALDNDASLESGMHQGIHEARVVGDPTEAALIVAAAKAGAYRDSLERAYPRVGEIPFDSERKRMTTIHRIESPEPEDASPFYNADLKEWEVAAIKGAPDVILELCTRYQRMDDTSEVLSVAMRREILLANDEMARSALRVIAVAYRVENDVPWDETPEAVEQDFIFVGLMGMIDPPREQVRIAVGKARTAGIRTLMITGDYADTARAIAAEIALLASGHTVLAGAELDRLDEEGLQEAVRTTDVFARVSPEHKVRIVDALKANGEIVAMTGDGVNDAPALKRADIGVAMGITGTDVAKETADMVLTDDNYASIVAAVEQGRIIYSNIRKFVFYLLSCNLAEITVILLAILAGWPSPLTAIQLLWLNLITDGGPALALGVEKGDPDTMERPPRPPREPVINQEMRLRIAIQTAAIAGVTLTAYYAGLQLFPDQFGHASTMAFVTLSASELLRAVTARSDHYPIYKVGVFSSKWMIAAVVSSFALLLAVVYIPFLQPVFDTVPLSLKEWEIILPLLLVPALVAELSKAASEWRKRWATA
jgi:Ca2+-transporting ATPase